MGIFQLWMYSVITPDAVRVSWVKVMALASLNSLVVLPLVNAWQGRMLCYRTLTCSSRIHCGVFRVSLFFSKSSTVVCSGEMVKEDRMA